MFTVSRSPPRVRKPRSKRETVNKERGITVSAAPSADKIQQAKQQLDAHVREIVNWHFDPDTGTPFWLEKAKSFKFNPRKDVKCFDDLKLFGHFEDEWLRGG